MKFQTRTKVFATILAAAVAVAPTFASAAPLSTLLHLHPHTKDTRVRVVLYNQTYLHDQVRIAGKVYTVEPQHTLVVTAPVGTPIYAASKLASAENGSLLFEIKPGDESHRLILD